MEYHVRIQVLFVAAALALGGCGAGLSTGDASPTDDAAMNAGDASPATDTAPATDAPVGVDSAVGADAESPPVLGPEVPIQIAGSCPAFTACGGDPSGSWQYSAVCIADLLPELAASCPGMTVEGTGTARGGVTFAGGIVRRNVSTRFNVTTVLPAACTFGMCGTVQSSLRSAGYPDASCASAGGGCRCTFTATGNVNDGSPYTVQGTQVIAGGTRYDFCVSGGSLRYRELGTRPAERGIASLSRR